MRLNLLDKILKNRQFEIHVPIQFGNFFSSFDKIDEVKLKKVKPNKMKQNKIETRIELNKFKSAFSRRRTQCGHLLLARYPSRQIQSRALVPLAMPTSWHATIVSIGSSIAFQSNFVRQRLHSESAEFPFLTNA
jgi:hypothetical protein